MAKISTPPSTGGGGGGAGANTGLSNLSAVAINENLSFDESTYVGTQPIVDFRRGNAGGSDLGGGEITGETRFSGQVAGTMETLGGMYGKYNSGTPDSHEIISYGWVDKSGVASNRALSHVAATDDHAWAYFGTPTFGSFTAAMWVYPTATGKGIFVLHDDTNNPNVLGRHAISLFREDDNTWKCYNETTGYFLASSATALSGAWHHFVITWAGTANGSVWTMYHDGTVAALGTAAFPEVKRKLWLGRAYNGAMTHYTKEFRFYNASWGTAEVAADYNGGTGRYTPADDPGLWLGYHGNEGTYPTRITDFSGNGRHAYPNGALTTVAEGTIAQGTLGVSVAPFMRFGSATDIYGPVIRFGQGLEGTTTNPENILTLSEWARFTSSGLLGIGTTDPRSGVHINTSLSLAYERGIDTHSLTSENCIIGHNPGAGFSKTYTLPAAAGCVGRLIIIKDEEPQGSAGNIVIEGNASETIDGATAATITVNYGWWMGYSNGTKWLTISSKLT